MLLLSDHINTAAALNSVEHMRKYYRLNRISRVRSDLLVISDISFSVCVQFAFNKKTGAISDAVYLRSCGVRFCYGKNKSLNDISHAKERYLKHLIINRGRGV